MARKTAFIFDMDGTLVDNMNVHMRVWIEILGRLGIRVTPEEYQRQAMGKTNRQILRQLVGDHLTDEDIAEYAERKESVYREKYGPHIKPMNGLIDFLRGCRRLEIPLALATSAPRLNIEFVLGRLGIETHFRVIVSAEEVERGKPDPEMFLTAAQRLGVEPNGCLVFEDSLFGIEAAHRAGMKSVAITTTSDAGDFEQSPGVIRIAPDFLSIDPESLLAAMQDHPQSLPGYIL